MKKLHLFKTVLLLCALIVGSSSVWAEEDSETITMNSKTSIEGTNVTFTFAKGSGSTNPALNNNKTRLYPGNTITITASEKYLKQVDFTFVTNNGGSGSSKACPTGVTVSTGSETFGTTTTSTTSGSWIAGDEKTTTVTITINGAKGNYTFSEAEVIYVKASDPSLSYWVATYDYNDGVTDNKEVHVDKTTEAASYTLESAPSRTNFTFLGWNDGTTNYDGGADYPMTADKTFTAQWEYSGPCTTYNKSSKSDLATGAQYILVGDKSGTNHFANDDIAKDHLYFSSSAVSNAYSSITSTKAIIVDEEPLVLTLEETADGWYLKNADGDKLGMTGNKEMDWNSGDMTWDLGGSEEVPTFTATYSSSDYTMYYNSSATRFNSYTSKGSNVNAYFYRLDNDKVVYTLTLDFNDGETADGTHRVLEGASYTLTAPTRADYTFIGWNTEEDGTGTSYAASAYTMPAAATTLYAQWRPNSVPATITAAAKYATFVSPYATDFSDTGITVYTATDKKTTVGLNVISSGKIPANTPVVLYKADADGSLIPVPVIASASSVVSNDLRVSTGTDVENMYVLANKSNGVGFYPWKGTTDLSAGKVYLQAKASYDAREFIGFGDDETTDIKATLRSNEMMNGEVYNLAGQRIAQPSKGLYIVNGKKVVIK